MSSIKISGLFLLAGSLSLSAFAQNRQYTMAEAVNGMTTTLAPQALKQAAWRPGTHELYFAMIRKTLNVFFPQGKDSFYADREGFKNLNANNGAQWLDKSTAYLRHGDTLTFVRRTFRNNDTNIVSSNSTLPEGAENLEVHASGWFAFNRKKIPVCWQTRGSNLPLLHTMRT
jgi:hypothetical protein